MRVSSCFTSDGPTLSFEFFPPKTEAGTEGLLQTVDRLVAVSPDFVSITYGAGGSTRTQTLDLCIQIAERTGGAVMAHLTCVCHTRDELEAIADGLWSSGIRNIMALRGDRPKNVESLAAHVGELAYSQDLMTLLRGRHDFCLGGACYPEGHTETPDISRGIEHLKAKIDAGCEFLVTQMFFDNDAFFPIRRIGPRGRNFGPRRSRHHANFYRDSN